MKKHQTAKSFDSIATIIQLCANCDQPSQHQDGLCDSCHQAKMDQKMQAILQKAEQSAKASLKGKVPNAKQTLALQAIGEAAQAIGDYAQAYKMHQMVQAAKPSTFTWYYTTEALKAAGITKVECFLDTDGKYRFRANLDGSIIYWGNKHMKYFTANAKTATKWQKELQAKLAN